ncbi:MAG: RNA polymerase sigma factor [Flavobacteriaceae bacterium]
MMFNASLRIVRNKHDAEDIVQESFMKGFGKIGDLKEEVNLGAWLKRIVINASLDTVRKRKKESWIEEGAIVEAEVEEVELENDSNATIQMIKECMEELKEKYRVILILYMIEDYNHREISELLNIKESTVRNQYRRGKNMLLEMIQKRNKYEFKGTHTGT